MCPRGCAAPRYSSASHTRTHAISRCVPPSSSGSLCVWTASATARPRSRHRPFPERRPMTTMIAEIYDAFKEANVSDATARKAAEAVAAYEARFAGLELKLEQIGGRVNLLTWMVGLNFTVTLGVLWLLLRTAAKVGALG